jgi:hypothetical protein
VAEEETREKGFKVEDRRRFSAEGELRPEHRGAEAASEAPAAHPTQAEAKQPAGPSADTARATGAAAEPELSFATFIVGLSTEALALLGEMPDPVTGERRRDLKGAQQLIDIIGMLREKTRGNLDGNEEQLIDAILFDLRMKYVEIARQPAGR